MKSPLLSVIVRPSAAILICLMHGGCSAPQPVPLPLDDYRSDTGTVVATNDDTITVLMNGQLAKIQLEGFASEGAHVAAAVRRSPAHARIARLPGPAVTSR